MNEFDAIFYSWHLSRGRCFGSKSTYRAFHPKALFISNAWVCDARGKIWGGDLDLTGPDLSRLQKVAGELGTTLYVLSEQGRDVSGSQVVALAEVVVTATEATLSRSALCNLTPVLADGKVRVTRSLP